MQISREKRNLFLSYRFDLNNIDVKYKKLRAKIIAARFENVTLKDHTSSKRAEFAIDEIPTVKVYNSETNVQKSVI